MEQRASSLLIGKTEARARVIWQKRLLRPANESRNSSESKTVKIKTLRFLYDLSNPIKEKIDTIAKEIYEAAGVEYSELSEKQIVLFTRQGFGKLPICMAKTQYSLSHDPNKKGAPTGKFSIIS